MKNINGIIAVGIILSNLYFLPFNIITVVRNGIHGFGFLLLTPVLISSLLLIPAILALLKKYNDSILLFIINGIGLLWNILLMIFLLSTPSF